MIRRPPRSTLDRSSAASDVYKRQAECTVTVQSVKERELPELNDEFAQLASEFDTLDAVSYTHLRAHETVLDLVCRLLLEKKKSIIQHSS